MDRFLELPKRLRPARTFPNLWLNLQDSSPPRLEHMNLPSFWTTPAQNSYKPVSPKTTMFILNNLDALSFHSNDTTYAALNPIM